MSTNRLYDAWFEWLWQQFSKERVTRLRSLAALLFGMYMAQSVHMSKIACEIPGVAKALSTERRLTRLLDNRAIQPKRLFRAIAITWLQWCRQEYGRIVLILDGTKVSSNHQLLMVAVAVEKRAIPIAWTWMCSARGHSSRQKQLALLSRVQAMIPKRACVIVVGDSEFGAVDVLKHLDKVWHWQFVLRQKSNNSVRPAYGRKYRRFDTLVTHVGESRFWVRGRLTEKFAYRTNLLAYWGKGENEPWLLATNLPTAAAACAFYKQRMLIEQMFGDFKGHGFDLEHTRLRHFHRLNRLVLCVALLYTWLIRTGIEADITTESKQVDRNDRRDLSHFTIAIRWVKRLLINSKQVTVCLTPPTLPKRIPVTQTVR